MTHTFTRLLGITALSFLLGLSSCKLVSDKTAGNESSRTEDSIKIVNSKVASALRCPDLSDVQNRLDGKPEGKKKFFDRLMGLYQKLGLDNTSRALDPGGIPEQVYYAIQVNVLTPNGQSYATDEKIVAAVQKLNDVFAKIYVNFKIVGITRINTQYHLENFYYELGNGYIEDFFDTNNKKNAINLYLVDNTPDGSMLNGFTYPVDFEYSPNGRNRDLICLGSRTIDNGKTLIHEMGHFFTLMHTFNSASQGGGTITDEYADGSNCQTSGDLICDTPADPFDAGNIDVRSCTYVGDKKDPRGTAYHPMVNNFMAYYEACCDYRFTEGQYRVIRKIADQYRSYLRKRLPSTPIPATPSTAVTTPTSVPSKPVTPTPTTTVKPSTTPPASVTVKPTPSTTTAPSKPTTTTSGTKPTTTTTPAKTTTTPAKTTTAPTSTVKPSSNTPPKPSPMVKK